MRKIVLSDLMKGFRCYSSLRFVCKFKFCV